ncbi:enoyl-CoA hydratase [Texcoconibacillus texcoconensis]|uniref:Enoyl-CoA hydratase n=1 Tax=Texcoconibacillus texcoconensis TaxID=1095777 RepID=A0A840QMX0_9BACI|nr:enoyl-CoA hydratase [Texcoconibacillus texcoconensis]MBB5172681.1 enoyl-CoA hydratase [Texcoconibacillus texcoconensis]
MPEAKQLTVHQEDQIAVVTLNNPPANALSQTMIQELDDAFKRMEQDDEIRVVILQGEGRFFAAGADIKEFANDLEGGDFQALSQMGQRTFERISSFSKPVIAAIHGAALGGGLELALACHLRLTTESAKLGLPELQLGLIPGFAGTQRLPQLVGRAKALEMLLTAEPIRGQDAVKWQLVNRVCSEDDLEEEALNLARTFARNSRKTVEDVLSLTRYAASSTFTQGSEEEARLFGQIFKTDDAKEGIEAFLEKRKPQFTDR